MAISAGLALAPVQLERADGVLEAAKGDVASIGEQELLAGDDLAHTFRDENLAGLGLRGDAGGEDDGRAEQVLLLLDRLTGVQAAPHARRVGRRLVVFGEGALEGDGAIQSAGR